MDSNKSEYKKKCDECKSSGGPTHARSYLKKIKGKWLWLCKTCWNKKN